MSDDGPESMNPPTKLALGTVQFGIDYGVSNTAGRVPVDEVECILDVAYEAGIRLIDTAWSYGEAEAVLGHLHAAERFDIVTKTAPVDDNGYRGVAAEIGESLVRLELMPAYGVLVHAAADLLGEYGEGIAKLLVRSRDNGAMQHIGVSAYNAEELYAALEVLDADLVQLPVNVFDQRLVKSGVLTDLKARGLEIHARSAFLQGLLLMEPDAAPAYFDPIRPRLAAWRMFCAERGLSPLQAALGFVTGLPEVDRVIVGVESAQQLTQVIAASTPLDPTGFDALALDDPEFVEPSRWRVGS